MFTQINFLAIVVSAIAAMLIAFIYYAPPVLGLRWATMIKRYSGLSDAQLSAGLPLHMGLWFVSFLINAFALALLLRMLGAADLTSALTVGVVAAIGLGVTVGSWPVIHAQWPRGVWLLNSILLVLQQIVMAIILTLWR